MSPLHLGAADLVLAGLAAVVAGAVNALAGGGTLITFPALVALGLPAVTANITNTVALCPGYFGATVAQSADLRGQRRRLWIVVPTGMVGGVAGGLLLLGTGERTFHALVPFLILAASALLAAQGPMRAWLARQSSPAVPRSELWVGFPIAVSAVYGGYFGAGLSVIVLAVLGLLLDDSLTRLNALKQAVALGVNVAAAACFLFSGQVAWRVAAVMAAGALVGGAVGGRLAGRVPPATLRWVVVAIGLVVGTLYLIGG